MPVFILVVLAPILLGLVIFQRRIVSRWETRWARIAGNVGIVVAVALFGAAFVGLQAGSGAIEPSRVRWISAVGLSWIATVFYLLISLIVLTVVWIVVRIAGWIRPALAPRGRTVVRVVAGAGLIASLLITGYGAVAATTPQVTNTIVTAAGMPAEFGPLRVAVLSDIHVGPVNARGFMQKVVDETNAQNPDVVFIAGDVVDGTVAQIGDYLTPLSQLRAPLGVFGVTGNHEYYADDPANWVARWRELGIRPLLNESAVLERGGAQITVVGVNDDAGSTSLAQDVPAALAGVDPSAFNLGLVHQPSVASEFARGGVDLSFSGHTHGGQIWPFRYFVQLDQPTVSGPDVIDGMQVYTSRGAGTWGPPVRVFTPPEIAIVTVTPAAG